MCTICSATRTFDPQRHGDDAGPEALLFVEGADAAESIFTAYSIDVGDVFQGTISNSSDEDWIAVSLTAGETYEITHTGLTLSDPLLRLRDADGNVITVNDDSNGSLDSEIIFTASTSGTYYIEADAYLAATGTYEIAIDTIATTGPATEATLDELALYLTEGYWGGREFTFNTNTITVNLSGLTAEGQQLARWAMEAWEAVVDIEFVEVGFGEMITFDDENAGAYAYAPGGSGPDGVELNISTNWLAVSGTSIDSYSFQTYVHEIGHAIGLGHQGDYNGGARYGIDNTFVNDSWQVSVMSYFDQTDNTFINASFGYTAGPMMADILAIQNLYGAPDADSATAGDTIYGRGSNLGTYMDEVFDWLATDNTTANVTGNAMVFTLYDRDGFDTLNLDFLTVDARLDMRAEEFSDFGSNIGVMGIARGTVLEEVITGSGNDTITGNEADNVITSGVGADLVNGGTGNDVVNGGGGNDMISGEIGFDTLNGGEGNDTLLGGDGADSLFGDAGNDRLEGGQGFDQLYGGTGNDTLLSGETADRVFGGDGNDLIRGGSNFGLTVDGLYGEAGNDTIFGDGGFDLIDGGDGDDLLDGGGQADNLFGRDGNDVLLGGDGLDRLFGGNDEDDLDGGAGNDGLFGESGNDSLSGGAGNDNFFGGQGNDLILGGTGNDTVNGGAGFDTIEGGTGDDLMFGRFNADTFVFADGHGNDTIGDFSAGNRFERIDLSDVSAIDDLSDLQVGNANGGAATQVGADVVIDTGAGTSITLIGVDLSDLDATNFIF